MTPDRPIDHEAGGGLTEEHRQAILAAIPPGVVAGPEVWRDLEEIFVGFRQFRSRRTKYPIKEERKRWRRVTDLTTKLTAEMRLLQRQRADPDLWPDRALAVLGEISKKAETRAAYHETWSAFRGTKNPYREFLYGGLLTVWTDRLGGKLRYSTAPDGTPTGPLIKFFLACVKPILGAETPRAGVADIIDREREARNRAKRL